MKVDNLDVVDIENNFIPVLFVTTTVVNPTSPSPPLSKIWFEIEFELNQIFEIFDIISFDDFINMSMIK